MVQHIKNSKHLILLFLVAIATVLLYFWAIHQPFWDRFLIWASDHTLAYFVVLVFLKALAIVWPPLPGGFITLGSVAVVGWKVAFLGQVVGGLIGGSIAYLLGKKYGYWLLEQLFDQTTLAKIHSIKIYKHREFEMMIFLRIFTGSISEAISYGAGLVGIHFRNFILGTLIGFAFELPIFYLAQSVLAGKNLFISGSLILVAGFLFYKLKGRYFE